MGGGCAEKFYYVGGTPLKQTGVSGGGGNINFTEIALMVLLFKDTSYMIILCKVAHLSTWIYKYVSQSL